ncbi:MAG TPA: tRNA (adenosine(37)-N6)-threonylcarbamoyltransferase complex dimerization subunit type 1 TsaB [Cyclobacteriaceae bacterium]
MANILSIETATKSCAVALVVDNTVISSVNLKIDNSHSKLLHGLIANILRWSDYSYKQIDAIAISSGPGSYTGLRIGASTAKGLCYALDIPLVSVNTLLAMAYNVKKFIDKDYLLVPMIDARRMEVYTLVCDSFLNVKEDTRSSILDTSAFRTFDDYKLVLFGNGSVKARKLFEDRKNISFISNIIPSADTVGIIAEQKFINNDLVDYVDFEPNYLKEFYLNKV